MRLDLTWTSLDGLTAILGNRSVGFVATIFRRLAVQRPDERTTYGSA